MRKNSVFTILNIEITLDFQFQSLVRGKVCCSLLVVFAGSRVAGPGLEFFLPERLAGTPHSLADLLTKFTLSRICYTMNHARRVLLQKLLLLKMPFFKSKLQLFQCFYFYFFIYRLCVLLCFLLNFGVLKYFSTLPNSCSISLSKVCVVLFLVYSGKQKSLFK